MARPFHHSTVGGSLDALAKYYKLGQKGTEIVNAKKKRLEDFSPQELAATADYCMQGC